MHTHAKTGRSYLRRQVRDAGGQRLHVHTGLCSNRVLVVEILGLGIIIGKGRGDGQRLPKVALSVARLEMQCRLQQARQDIG
jgi:hypothetical protein